MPDNERKSARAKGGINKGEDEGLGSLVALIVIVDRCV